MAIHKEAVHVTNADVPDEHAGGLFEVPLLFLYGLRGVQEKGAKQLPLTQHREMANGLETWQSSLLYVFVRFYRVDPAQNSKIQNVVMCAYTTIQ